jgi:hypothetical protein
MYRVAPLPRFKGTPHQIRSRWIAALERQGCDVRGTAGALEVWLPEPGLPGGWGPPAAAPWLRDRARLTLSDEGEPVIRLDPRAPARLALHAAGAAVFVAGWGEWDRPGGALRLALAFAICQALVPLASRLGLALLLGRLSREAARATG